jgi:hypothetical protein
MSLKKSDFAVALKGRGDGAQEEGRFCCCFEGVRLSAAP